MNNEHSLIDIVKRNYIEGMFIARKERKELAIDALINDHNYQNNVPLYREIGIGIKSIAKGIQEYYSRR
ncbi:MAG: hypothetical protein WC758_00400 [Candidatus Woesearchaeota archaeon]|jgi:hypothetical protein